MWRAANSTTALVVVAPIRVDSECYGSGGSVAVWLGWGKVEDDQHVLLGHDVLHLDVGLHHHGGGGQGVGEVFEEGKGGH